MTEEDEIIERIEMARGTVSAQDITFDPEADQYAALFGLSRADIVNIVLNPSRSTLDSRSNDVDYPIINHYGGDVRVTVGYRDPESPRVLHVTVTTEYDAHRGSQKATGVSGSSLPRSYRQLRKRILERGYSISVENHPKVLDKETGELVFVLAGTPSDYRSVANSWRAFLRAEAVFKAKGSRKEEEQ